MVFKEVTHTAFANEAGGPLFENKPEMLKNPKKDEKTVSAYSMQHISIETFRRAPIEGKTIKEDNILNFSGSNARKNEDGIDGYRWAIQVLSQSAYLSGGNMGFTGMGGLTPEKTAEVNKAINTSIANGEIPKYDEKQSKPELGIYVFDAKDLKEKIKIAEKLYSIKQGLDLLGVGSSRIIETAECMGYSAGSKNYEKKFSGEFAEGNASTLKDLQGLLEKSGYHFGNNLNEKVFSELKAGKQVRVSGFEGEYKGKTASFYLKTSGDGVFISSKKTNLTVISDDLMSDPNAGKSKLDANGMVVAEDNLVSRIGSFESMIGRIGAKMSVVCRKEEDNNENMLDLKKIAGETGGAYNRKPKAKINVVIDPVTLGLTQQQYEQGTKQPPNYNPSHSITINSAKDIDTGSLPDGCRIDANIYFKTDRTFDVSKSQLYVYHDWSGSTATMSGEIGQIQGTLEKNYGTKVRLMQPQNNVAGKPDYDNVPATLGTFVKTAKKDYGSLENAAKNGAVLVLVTDGGNPKTEDFAVMEKYLKGITDAGIPIVFINTSDPAKSNRGFDKKSADLLQKYAGESGGFTLNNPGRTIDETMKDAIPMAQKILSKTTSEKPIGYASVTLPDGNKEIVPVFADKAF